jgi:NAD(P)H-dependent flavin oxidoreductase YrpB (nitropropane dioxygenase family)
VAIPASLQKGLILPIISAPMFLVSGPDLVVEACNAGRHRHLPVAEPAHDRGLSRLDS